MIALAKVTLDKMLAEARAAHPRECCGILLGEGNRIDQATPAKNVHPTPQSHFEIDPQVLIDAHRAAREGGPQVAGYYHSHTVGEPEPSQTDAAMASGDGRIWAIMAGDTVRFWQDQADGFREVSYAVAD
ncbi:Mov34/MPN/PAD-1 family protein [Altererythrobacter lutimaris]|uniref:M67 family metallopeptidase n=1 Tax=Altererythrobacter lutimaris TaxID=2743979 RepID=A0A850HCM8_9SPHN|nr:M67 family metallopeptidase [Altererythrobacter lutimaris]NVE94801.1 M67 family metallopeptidase [Altererythrobacter lutimaris]